MDSKKRESPLIIVLNNYKTTAGLSEEQLEVLYIWLKKSKQNMYIVIHLPYFFSLVFFFRAGSLFQDVTAFWFHCHVEKKIMIIYCADKHQKACSEAYQ